MIKRETFFQSIADKMGRERRSSVQPPARFSAPRKSVSYTDHELIHTFTERATALKIDVHPCTYDTLANHLTNIVKREGSQSIISWGDEQDDTSFIRYTAAETGAYLTCWDKNKDEQSLRTAASAADIGITFADFGIAESGTLIITNGCSLGRLVSLLPPVYVAVLSVKHIIPHLSEAMKLMDKQNNEDNLPACINFISGPSTTGDLQAEMALGVHGPGSVYVLLVS
ncbi:LutC/YkgG family protein [Alteribacillus iranensis]|uniref:L-lactate dehydrogenase complex protein LldG n=1 Tax=Alteribacillus iranensis TaxID=930128 RepID=A0A1I2CNU7_9BACI|nr:lactate utilization protein C [Alteribacillus iranensis]SFE69976.1 L-lactate dehydrogenase complex protein LldG [Alteribacillus iranensis]